MIGYLKPFTPELKLKHWEFYKSLYCSLCINTKSKFSNFHRLFINNDSIFLYLLFISTIDNIKFHFEKKRCIFHPVNKTTIFVEDKYFNLFVEISFLISYIKIMDNIYDNISIKFKIFKKLFDNKISKLKLINSYNKNIDTLIRQYFENEKKIFKNNKLNDINELINPFYNLLISLLPLDFLDNKVSPSLKLIIRHIIKIIFILDAYEDFEDDLKKGKQNILAIYFKTKLSNSNEKEKNNFSHTSKNKLVYSLKNKYEIKNELKSVINYSFNIINEEFEKLPIKYNKELIENFLFYSLPVKADELISGNSYYKSIYKYQDGKKYLKQIHEKW